MILYLWDEKNLEMPSLDLSTKKLEPGEFRMESGLKPYAAGKTN